MRGGRLGLLLRRYKPLHSFLKRDIELQRILPRPPAFCYHKTLTDGYSHGATGAFHQISVKHLSAYLDEFEFRFNNRENPYIFRDAMRLLLDSENVEYKELVS